MTEGRAELEAFKAAMQPLEPGSDERRQLASQVVEQALAYLDANPDAPANNPREEVFSHRLDPEFSEEGRNPETVLSYIGQSVVRPGFATTSPRFMAYIPGGALFHSALGDFLAAVSNKYSGFASASPGAVRLENACCAWMAKVIGYPETSAGTLTSGGSLANLTAIVTAREARDPDAGGAIYMTRFVHHCVDKALHIAGRGRARGIL